MIADKLVDSTQLDSDLTSVANAIRAKSGGSSQLAFPAGFVSAIAGIPAGNFELIGTKVFENVAEWTDASNWDNMDTGISFKNTPSNDYALGYVVVTCDSVITTSTEWGMTIAIWGRTYSASGSVWRFGNGWQKGTATLSFAAMVANPSGQNSYGVCVQDNTANIVIQRKANSSACPKIRAGNYTVKVYGMTAI